MTTDTVQRDFIPAAYNERFARFFGWWVRDKMMKSKFYAVRIVTDTAGALDELRDHRGPVICACNHVSWWDPLVMFTLHRMRLCASANNVRTLRAPMDAAQLKKFGFFRKLGVFGIDPDNPQSLAEMTEYLGDYFHAEDCPTLWINPQGRFADTREPVEVRPGVAKVAASHPDTRVVAIAFEYGFWLDAKPELFVRFQPVEPKPSDDGSVSTTGWVRAMKSAMTENTSALAERVIARDPAGFVNLLGGEGANNHPIYALWLKLRGKEGALDDRRDRRLMNEGAGSRKQSHKAPKETLA